MYIFLNVLLPEITLARRLIWQNLHLAEITFPRKTYCPEFTLVIIHIPKTYFSEIMQMLAQISLGRIYMTQKLQPCLFSKINS